MKYFSTYLRFVVVYRDLLFLSVVSFVVPAVAKAQPSVLTERYNNARTGANLTETSLRVSNVNSTQFGKLFTYNVSGCIQAQLLYVPLVTIPGKGVHNVIYAASMDDILYCFDADSNAGENASPLWTHDFTNPGAGVTAVPIVDLTGSNFLNISGNVGIESTPVIDPVSKVMYLVARTKENGRYFQYLHAIAIETGADLPGSPVVIRASVPSTVFGTLTFDPKIHNQRASLALADGKIMIAWASHEDLGEYHGWVMAYNAATLEQSGVFCVTPSGNAGGIWQAGWAPAVDSNNNVYYVSGNGFWDGSSNFGESILKMSVASGITLVDWFTPDNWRDLNSVDLDLGSSGPLLIPRTNLIIAGGKESIFYLAHTDALGHQANGNVQIVQLLNVHGGEIKGGPVYWDRANATGPWLYVWSNNDYLKAYHFNGTTFDPQTVSQSTFQAAAGASGGVLTLSANGDTPGTGIIWSSMPFNRDGDHGVGNGVLRAFDADDLSHELWNSEQNRARDNMGGWPKFNAPLVMNGKVYSGSFTAVISVYGLFSNPPVVASPVFDPPAGNYPSARPVTITTATSGASIRYTTNGTPPTATSGMVYSAPVFVDSSMTLKAIAYKVEYSDSLVTSAVYSIGTDGPGVYQAEDGTHSSGTHVDTASLGWTGTGYVSMGTANHDWVEWAVTVPRFGIYTLDVRYANGTPNNWPASLRINDIQVQSAAPFPPTKSWTAWGDYFVTVALRPGVNKVRVTANGSQGSANLDKLTLH